jgi:glycosyltransferase 2 family protein
MVLPAALIWLVSNGLTAFSSAQLCRATGINLDFRTCLLIHCRRLPAKYLPGGIWSSVGRASDYMRLGNDARQVGWFFLVENLILVAVTLSLGAALVATLPQSVLLREILGWLPLPGILGLIFMPLGLQLLSRKRLTLHSSSAFYSAVLGTLIFWCLAGASFAFWIAAFPGLELQVNAVQTAGVYVFSWSIGYLALFAPQGIGVSEFVSGYLLAGADAARLLGFIVSFRLMVLTVDLITWSLSFFMRNLP